MSGRDLVAVNIPALAMSEGELVGVLQASVYPGAKVESIKLVIGYCRAQNLDPMTKPVHIVPMDAKTDRKDQNGDPIYEKRDVVMPGIGLYRIQAARTGEYGGISEPEFGPTKMLKYTDEVWESGQDGRRHKSKREAEFEYPEWCKVTVRRIVGDRIVEFTARELWIENYATAGRWSRGPNAMWKKRPFGQIAKCAEAQALRKGFPEVGAQPTAEEMEGKALDPAEGVVIEGESAPVRAVALPQARSAQQPEPEPQTEPRPASTAGTNDVPASPGQIKLIRSKAAAATITEEEIIKEFKLATLDGISCLTGNCILEFLKDPAGYRAKQ